MKKKTLVVNILFALSVTAFVPIDNMQAAEFVEDSNNNFEIDQNNTLIIQSNKTVTSETTFNGNALNQFENVEIHYTANKDGVRPIGVYSAQYDLTNTNLTVYTEGKNSDNDALHFTNHYPHFNIHDLNIYANAKGSDGINLSRDITTDTSVNIGGNLNVSVKDGNGIRANASINGDHLASINVKGNTNITVQANAGNLLSAGLNNAAINPTAVWAGSDANSTTMDQKALGRGEIKLNGNTTIKLLGNGQSGDGYTLFRPGKVYGISAGKNGYIESNNINITANGNYSYGVSASDVNVSHNYDSTINKYGSIVILNGQENIIQMNGTNSYAIYAKEVDSTGNSNAVKSGENGIGYVKITGNIAAEDGGLIDLHMTGSQSWIEGNITAQGASIGSGVTAFSADDVNDDAGATVNIMVDNALSGQGTLAAANGGTVNVELGAGSSWSGRADDYQDAESSSWDSHNEVIDNAFGNDTEIGHSGTVNLTLHNGAMWNVMGQSWLTKLSGNGVVFLSDDTSDDTKEDGHALHIGTVTGENTFVMNVRPENGDMLYVKNGTNEPQHLVINNANEVLETMQVNEAVRFATIANAGEGFNEGGFADMPADMPQTFGRSTRISDAGMFNVDFDIVYNPYDEEMKGDLGTDDSYNGDSFGENKPGTDYVDTVYGGKSDGNSTNNLAETAKKDDNRMNAYIVRKNVTMDNISDAGKTVVAMSRINYSNAIYMDRMNKRMGEARYIDGDEGLWVRMRHDRIGKSDAFRSMNTMMELGYDTRVNDREDGEHRQGVAIDYMRGTADYKNVTGEGDVRRGGIWLYDTWLGNKGHYTDYVLKFGRLSNDFELYTRTLGEKVTGDYSNFVYSASAEYGRKKDLGNNWYIEPQAQIQYAHVTDADYTTSQDTHVQLDAIDSLIGRVGFRLGKDVGEKSTFYIKADVLHEFLGDQDIEARDATGLLSTTYENEGTWYDIGLGFSHQFSKGTYMYLDMEKSIGNDNEDTYQFNFGMNWKV